MSETVANLAQKNARNALQRIEYLERLIPQLLSATNNAMNQAQMQFSGLVEIVDALVQAHGPEAVEAIVVENRRNRALKQVEGDKAFLKAALDSGEAKAADTVTEDSIIVFNETTEDGVALDPGRAQFQYKQLMPAFRPQVLGKGTGTKVVSPQGNVFEVVEIYSYTPKAEVEAATEAMLTEAAPAATTEAK